MTVRSKTLTHKLLLPMTITLFSQQILMPYANVVYATEREQLRQVSVESNKTGEYVSYDKDTEFVEFLNALRIVLKKELGVSFGQAKTNPSYSTEALSFSEKNGGLTSLWGNGLANRRTLTSETDGWLVVTNQTLMNVAISPFSDVDEMIDYFFLRKSNDEERLADFQRLMTAGYIGSVYSDNTSFVVVDSIEGISFVSGEGDSKEAYDWLSRKSKAEILEAVEKVKSSNTEQKAPFGIQGLPSLHGADKPKVASGTGAKLDADELTKNIKNDLMKEIVKAGIKRQNDHNPSYDSAFDGIKIWNDPNNWCDCSNFVTKATAEVTGDTGFHGSTTTMIAGIGSKWDQIDLKSAPAGTIIVSGGAGGGGAAGHTWFILDDYGPNARMLECAYSVNGISATNMKLGDMINWGNANGQPESDWVALVPKGTKVNSVKDDSNSENGGLGNANQQMLQSCVINTSTNTNTSSDSDGGSDSNSNKGSDNSSDSSDHAPSTLFSKAGIGFTDQANQYPIGQCTWGAKELAPWAHTFWGNGGQWADSAKAHGFTVGTKPTVGAIAVWNDGNPMNGGAYGHVAVVTEVNDDGTIRVKEANFNGNQSIGDYRGRHEPTAQAYIYPPKDYKRGGELARGGFANANGLHGLVLPGGDLTGHSRPSYLQPDGTYAFIKLITLSRDFSHGMK